VSIDVFFQPGRFDEFGQCAPLAAGEREAVERLLRRVAPSGPDTHDCWVVELGDGGIAEVFARDLREGCMFALRGFTPEIVRLLFDVLVAGNWVMLPAVEGCGAIAASMDVVHTPPDGFPSLTVFTSAPALSTLLVGAIGT
jgi:hypothetical protein